jgi:cytochrome c556
MKPIWSGAACILAAMIVMFAGQQADSAMAAQQASAAQQAPAAPAAPAAVSQDDADAIILDRQLVMQQLEKDSDALGNIVAGIQPVADLVPKAKAIAKGAKEAQKSFEAKVPGGGSKPELWANYDEFSKRMQLFVTKTDEMTKIAEAGDMLKMGESMVDALQCQQCHDLYRVKK